MDELTDSTFKLLNVMFPRAKLRLTHQFLDGKEGQECGFVPNDWDGQTVVTLDGVWWRKGESDLTVSRG